MTLTSYKRFGNKWSVNECLQLQREFELLQLSIDEIAQKHQRTPNAIMLKLDSEDLANYDELYCEYSQTQLINHYEDQYEADQEDQDYLEEQDDDNSSDYNENDYEADNLSDVSDDDDVSDSPVNLKQHITRLEKQINILTGLILKQTSTNSKTSIAYLS